MAVSQTMKSAVFDQETGEVFLTLLTINHPDLAIPLRFVNNTQDLVLGGNTYTAFPFDLELPNNKADTPPRARLTIDNVSRDVAAAIRSINSPPTVKMEVVRVIHEQTESFMTAGSLPTGYSLTRPTNDHDGTYIDSAGQVQDSTPNAARWNYDPVALTLNGLLNEPERTNLQLNSQQPYAAGSGWSSTGATLTRDYTTLLGLNAARGERAAAGADYTATGVGDSVLSGATAGRIFHSSMWAKNNGGVTGFKQQIREAGGAQPSATLKGPLETLTSSPVRFGMSKTIVEDDRTSLDPFFLISVGAGTHDNITVAFQIEEIPSGEEDAPSSWIPTAGAAATRNRDTLTRTGLNDGTYTITITREGIADEVLTGVAISGGTYEVPTSVYELKTIKYESPAVIQGVSEMVFPDFLLRDVEWNALQVSGELVVESLEDEPFPADTMTPASFPGVF